MTSLNPVKRFLRAFFVIAWFNGYLNLRRSPFSVANFVLTPLSILFFIYIFGGANAATYGLVGGVVAVTVSSSIVLETDAAFTRIVLKIQDMFVSSPVHPAAYVGGLALSEIISGIAGIVLFGGLLGYYHAVTATGFFIILVTVVLLWVCISSLGFLLSTFARDVRDLWVYSPILTMLLSFLPPVYYPLEIVPSYLHPVAYLAPTTFAAQAIRGAAHITHADALVSLGGLALYTVILVAIVGRRIRWRSKQ
jgi:ABC-2 type transport system permease protein